MLIPVINSPIFIALLMGAVAIGVAVWKRKNSDTDTLWHKLDQKLNKDEHEAFAKRIGKQVDNNEKNIAGVREGLAWLIGRQGGDADKVMKEPK